jgi:hypothetical protein
VQCASLLSSLCLCVSVVHFFRTLLGGTLINQAASCSRIPQYAACRASLRRGRSKLGGTFTWHSGNGNDSLAFAGAATAVNYNVNLTFGNGFSSCSVSLPNNSVNPLAPIVTHGRFTAQPREQGGIDRQLNQPPRRVLTTLVPRNRLHEKGVPGVSGRPAIRKSRGEHFCGRILSASCEATRKPRRRRTPAPNDGRTTHRSPRT